MKTLSQAKKDLKKFGAVEYKGFEIKETVTWASNWQKYSGRYVVLKDKEMLTDGDVSMTVAFTTISKELKKSIKE